MKHKSPVFSSALVTIREHPLLSAGLLFTIAGATILGILPPLVLETLINRLTVRQDFFDVPCYFPIFFS